MNARTQDAKPTAGPGTSPLAVPVSVDFANVSGGQLLVYGWVLGLSKQIARAEIRYGEALIDLMSLGIAVPRPDVAKHFPAQVAALDDAHGFYLNVPLPVASATPGPLRMSVWKKSGELSESTWPVSSGEAAAAFFFAQHRTTLDLLLTSLRAAEANRLRALAALPADAPATHAAAAQLQFGLDACHLMDGRVVVVLGWLHAGEAPLTAARITFGEVRIDALAGVKIGAAPHKPAGTNLHGESRYLSTFTWVGLLPEAAPQVTEASVELAAGSRAGSARHLLSRYGHVGLAQSLQALDPDQAIDLLERIGALSVVAADQPAWLQEAYRANVERLPPTLLSVRPRMALHCEEVMPVAPHGLFLTGWFDAERGVSQVACHNGRVSVRVDATWERLSRPDVAEHLKASGLAGEEDLGLLCYAAFDHPAVAYYLSVTTGDGVVRRMRLPPVPGVASALQSIRSILTTFALPHRRLRTLLDRQIGPAVRSAWAQRAANTHPVVSQRFGTSPSRPAVSVIVPLYGRYDFAEYQMALFADDADFQSTELIYFVDDPSIFDAFQAQCADLYGTYEVPFTLLFAGANLGFAGANNVAAAAARGEYLVLMNSDVMPKARGWLSDMLATFGALKNPGLLGVKLLYEDGSVQHAGMTFRRYPAWADLWINEHPDKGLSAQGLTGLRQVQAVTAACAMVDARLYRELGGLSEDYLIGDFEDSDFCLRAAAAGRRNYVALDIALYHLERQSQRGIGDARWRTNLTLYNCWLHHTRWAAQIERLQR